MRAKCGVDIARKELECSTVEHHWVKHDAAVPVLRAAGSRILGHNVDRTALAFLSVCNVERVQTLMKHRSGRGRFTRGDAYSVPLAASITGVPVIPICGTRVWL